MGSLDYIALVLVTALGICLVGVAVLGFFLWPVFIELAMAI